MQLAFWGKCLFPNTNREQKTTERTGLNPISGPKSYLGNMIKMNL